MEHVDTQITSHLLAALNLPSIREPPPPQTPNSQQDRPRPVEPSASKDDFTSKLFDRTNREMVSNSPHPLNSTKVKQESPISSGDLNGRGSESGGITTLLGGSSQPATSQSKTKSNPKKSTGASRTVNPSQHGSSAAVTTTAPAAPTKIGATTNPATTSQPVDPSSQKSSAKPTGRRTRRKWTEEETNDLIKGCHIHGAGNWKKILDDPQFTFIDRSSVDLKDRFRTCFPTEYRKNTSSADGRTPGSEKPASQHEFKNSKYPPKPTKTELEHAELVEKLGLDRHFPKAQRRERREFTAEEDCSLLAGFDLYGASWSKIQGDPALGLSHRRATDLRDRFRNAYPEKYEGAGFKARPRQRTNRTQRRPEKPSTPQPAVNPTPENPHHPTLKSAKPPAPPPAARQDSASLLIQGILSEKVTPSWDGAESDADDSEDQSPAPGSLALDPALNNGFQNSSLEQLTEEFLSKPAHHLSGQTSSNVVRWEDMATHPIFELEPSLTGTEPVEDRREIVELRIRKRPGDETGEQNMNDLKRLRA